MSSLDVDLFITNISIAKAIIICTESIHNQNDFDEGLNKSDLRNYCP